MPIRLATRRAHWIAENILLVPLLAALALGAGYWAFVLDRVPPYELYNGRIVPQRVAEFGFASGHWRVKTLRDAPYTAIITREIRDSTGAWHRVDEQKTVNVLGPQDIVAGDPFQIPRSASWGPARYRLIVCYTMHGLSLTRIWPVCVRWPELPFEIIPPPSPH